MKSQEDKSMAENLLVCFVIVPFTSKPNNHRRLSPIRTSVKKKNLVKGEKLITIFYFKKVEALTLL